MRTLQRIILVAITLLLTTHIQASEVKTYDHIKMFTTESLEQKPQTNASQIFEEIHSMLNAEIVNPKIIYEVTGFLDRLNHYIRTVPSVANQADRAFDAIFRYVQIHRNTYPSSVNDGLVYLNQLPYKENSDRLLQLFEITSYHNNYTHFSAALQFIEKSFKKFATLNSYPKFSRLLNQHINELTALDYDKNTEIRRHDIKERIDTYKRILLDLNELYVRDESIAGGEFPSLNGKTISFNVEKVISEILEQNAVVAFHGSIPKYGDKFEGYIESLQKGLFSEASSINGIEFKVGAAYRTFGYSTKVGKHPIIYVTASNPTSQDKLVNVNFRRMTSSGYIATSTDRPDTIIPAGTKNVTIGIMLRNINKLSKTLAVTVEVNDKEYIHQETPLYNQAITVSTKFKGRDFSFNEIAYLPEKDQLPDEYQSVLQVNESKLKYDKHTKESCGDEYSIVMTSYWHDDLDGQFLLYDASCKKWSGECDIGHRRQVLYKLPDSNMLPPNELVTLASNNNTYNSILSVNDINYDGEIELEISDSYCLSSSTSIKKIIDGKLDEVTRVASYSEGGYIELPRYKSNPFVYSD